jgi:hypothetical protein
MAQVAKYNVEMADGSEHQVEVDQRDWAAMEAREFPESAMVTKTRYLVWNSMRRNKLTGFSWAVFNESGCVMVNDTPDEEEEAVDTEDAAPLDS